jgi:hypothetical protein
LVQTALIILVRAVFLFWASRFGGFAASRRAIRSITFTALRRFGGSATIPLAIKSLKKV